MTDTNVPNGTEIMTQRQAAENGRRKYFTGRSCKRGHKTFRYTGTGVCVSCASGYGREMKKVLADARALEIGYVLLTLSVPHEDIKLVSGFAAALIAARNLAKEK
jgi:hypothetical protein